MKRPAFQFYPADWRKDSALQSCSIGARGLWIEMTCIMHECDPYGHLMVNGIPLTPEKLSRLVGEPLDTVTRLLGELEEAGVFSRNDADCIFSRRMVKDEYLRNVRADSGRLGGNPNLLKQKSNQTINQEAENKDKGADNHENEQNPTPSSSSSSSSSLTTPIPPKGAKRQSRMAICLRTFVDECKQKGESIIPANDPVMAYATEAGIPDEFLAIHWREFLARYTLPDAKRYKQWRLVFQRSVRGNWFRLWYFDNSNSCCLTTQGIQAKSVHKGKLQ